MAQGEGGKKLNEKQKRFCEEYVIDLNGKQAAIRAGYSEKTADVQASQLLTLLNVKEYVRILRAKQQERTGITADRVLEEIGKLAFSDIRKLYNEDGRLLAPHELDDEAAATIASFKTRTEATYGEESPPDIIEEYKRYDKAKALEMLGRHLGMFKDKLELSADEDLAAWLLKK